MKLPFMTHWADGNATYFIGKIWSSFLLQNKFNLKEYSQYVAAYATKFPNEVLDDEYENCYEVFGAFGIDIEEPTDLVPKFHTIRKGNRWKAGDKIHYCINDRSKNYFQFAPVILVKSVQNIRMIKIGEKFNITINSNLIFSQSSNVKELDFFAQNDGFNSFVEFEKFFFPNGFGEFEGQIIHWTELKY